MSAFAQTTSAFHWRSWRGPDLDVLARTCRTFGLVLVGFNTFEHPVWQKQLWNRNYVAAKTSGFLKRIAAAAQVRKVRIL